jgi:murein DD-endopeptidase MepM/ murein hydrolase activator NlpD
VAGLGLARNKDAKKGSRVMAETLVERVQAWLHETFPERQIYIRSDGRVQFFTFGPLLQAVLAAATLLFLGWVAFSTVNVIFKDRIIAAKERRFQQMQTAYENRVADLQLSYDEVNTALVSAEDKFKSAADELEAKQNTILVFLDRKRQVDAALTGSGVPTEKKGTALPAALPEATGKGGFSDEEDPGFTAAPAPVKPPPKAKPHHASVLDFGGTVGRIAGVIFGKRPADPLSGPALARHPVLKRLAVQTNRVRQISTTKTELMSSAEGQATKGVKLIQALLRRTGINPDKFEQRVAGAHGIGGPEVPMSDVRVDGVSDLAFQKAYVEAYATLDRLNQMLGGMRHVPLTVPVWGNDFELSSGFGPRYETLTHRYAFHPGIDLAGPWGATVRSTAPGIVTWAGPRGSYGIMVEIDHGFGIHTRYGHLSSVKVRIGARVAKDSPIGRLGSTGRSTGPHVHYEVWYDDVVRNPRNFIEAGRYVLKQE